MFCKNCGKQLPDDSSFCQYCGTNLAPNTGSSPTVNVPPVLSTPVKKKEYVIEKFIVSLIMTVIGWTVSFLICLIMMIIQNEFSIEFLIISITMLPIAYMVSSLQIPIKLKFEAEKSKIATMITTIFLVSLFTVIPLINMNISIVFLGILMMVLIVLFYRISIQIISKKEY